MPTSTGYGAALEGVTALLSMLASCASGITVVGIDNGFGAASAIARMFPAARAVRGRVSTSARDSESPPDDDGGMDRDEALAERA